MVTKPDGEAEMKLQDGQLIFINKVPAKVKRAIKKRFKEDKEFRNQIELQCGAKQS